MTGCTFKATSKDNLRQHIRKSHESLLLPRSDAKHAEECPTESPEESGRVLMNEYGSISLFDLASAESVLLLEQWRTAGADLFSTAEDSSTIMHAAAMTGSAGTVEYLLERGLEPAKRNSANKTPLDVAALHGNWETTQLLWESQCKGERIPLPEDLTHLVLRSGNVQTIAALIQESGPECIDQGTRPLLFTAATIEKPGVMSHLLSYKGINVNVKLKGHVAAIHEAVKTKTTDALRSLLAYPGIDVNQLDAKERSPLTCAIRAGNENAIRLLLSHKDLELRDACSWPREEIKESMSSGQYRMALVILENGRFKDNESICPLLRAAIVGREEEIRDLL